MNAMLPIEDCRSSFCMLGGSMEVDILFRFIGGQTHIGMPSGIKMRVWPSMYQYRLLFNLNTTSKHAPQVGKI